MSDTGGKHTTWTWTRWAKGAAERGRKPTTGTGATGAKTISESGRKHITYMKKNGKSRSQSGRKHNTETWTTLPKLWSQRKEAQHGNRNNRRKIDTTNGEEAYHGNMNNMSKSCITNSKEAQQGSMKIGAKTTSEKGRKHSTEAGIIAKAIAQIVGKHTTQTWRKAYQPASVLLTGLGSTGESTGRVHSQPL
jgi:hypothetical protein